MAARGRRRTSRSPPARRRCCTTASICCASNPSRRVKRAIARRRVPICSAAPAVLACSASAPCPGRATSHDLRSAGDADPRRPEPRPFGRAALGHGHRRLLQRGARRGRAVRPLAAVRRLLLGVPRPRPHLAPPPAMGPWRRHRGDLPADHRAALSPAALHLHPRLAGAAGRAADHAAAGAELSTDRASGTSARSTSGATTCSWHR